LPRQIARQRERREMRRETVFCCALAVLAAAACSLGAEYVETFDTDAAGWEYWTAAGAWANCPWQNGNIGVPADLNSSVLLRLVGYRELGLNTGIGGNHEGEVFTVDLRGTVPPDDNLGAFLLVESSGLGTWAAVLAPVGDYADWQTFTVPLQESLFLPLGTAFGTFDNMVENITGVFIGNPGIGTELDNAGWLVPEPASLTVLLAGCLGLLRRRTRCVANAR
jgi:hypothetical protein